MVPLQAFSLGNGMSRRDPVRRWNLGLGLACLLAMPAPLFAMEPAIPPMGKTSRKPPRPAIKGFEPRWARPGEDVMVHGTHLDLVRAVHLGNLRIPGFQTNASGLTLMFRLPAAWAPRFTVDAPIVLTGASTGAGTRPTVVRSKSSFTLLCQPGSARHDPEAPAPIIDRIAGIEKGFALLLGRHLDRVMGVQVGKAECQILLGHNNLGFKAPKGVDAMAFLDNPVIVSYRGGCRDFPVRRELLLGTLASLQARTRPQESKASAPAPPAAVDPDKPLNLGLPCLYLTQAVQRRDGSVPLVAGRTACLRAFLLADRPNSERPVVRVTIRDAGQRILLRRHLSAPLTGVPTVLDENQRDNSWNLILPGALVRPGNTVLAELMQAGPEGTLVAAGPAFPSSGVPMPMNVVEVPPIGITLIPVRWDGTTGNVDQGGRTLDSWVQILRKVMPVGEVDVKVGDVFDFTPANSNPGRAIPELARDLEAKRLLDDPWNQRYYCGVFRRREGSTIAGIHTAMEAPPGHRGTVVVADDEFTGTRDAYYFFLAHEMGHAFGLRHAPTPGTDERVDPDYPRPWGLLDASGFDVADLSPKDPDAWTDIMGYAGRQWISAHNWIRALERLAMPLEVHAQAVRDCLLVSGTVSHGEVLWEPAFELKARPGPPPSGDHLLLCLDRHGRVLTRVPFGLEAAEPKGPDPGQTETFTFLVPMSPEMKRSLAAVQVRLGEHRLPIVAAWDGRSLEHGPGQAPGEARRPTVRSTAERRIALQWDADRYPKLLALDPGSGRCLAVGTGGAVTFSDPGLRELDLRLSDGLRTTALRLPLEPVQEEH